MLWVPQKGVERVEHNTTGVATSIPGTSVTTSGTISVKGTPAQLIAATAFDSYWLTIVASNYALATATSEAALDILVGAATEDVLIANLLAGFAGGTGAAGTGPKRWDFPLYIPAGTRIAAQCAGARLTTAMGVAIYLSGGNGYPGHRVGSKVTTYGMGTVPNGTAITPGISSAEGAYAQITAATAEDNFALVPSFQLTGDTTTQIKNFFVDIGVGAATEEEVAQSYFYITDVNEMMGGPWNSNPVFQDIPSGTRLAMRASTNSGTLDAAYNGCIHAVS